MPFEPKIEVKKLTPALQHKVKAMSKLLPRLENFKGLPMKRGLMQMREYTGWKHKEPK